MSSLVAQLVFTNSQLLTVLDFPLFLPFFILGISLFQESSSLNLVLSAAKPEYFKRLQASSI